MNGYMFFGQKLEVRTMTKSEVHPDLFKGANRTFKKIPWKQIEMDRHNKERNEGQEEKRAKSAKKRDAARWNKIQQAGIEYEYSNEGYGSEKGAKEDKKQQQKKIGKTSVLTKGKKTPPAKESAVVAASTIERKRTTRSMQSTVAKKETAAVAPVAKKARKTSVATAKK